MIREGAQAPQPPPLPTTPVPAKNLQCRAAEDYGRERPVYQTRQASNLREKIVQLAYQKEQEQAVRESTRLLSRQRSGKQQQQQQDCLDQGRDVTVYVCDLNSGGDAGGGNADLGTAEGGSRRYWDCTGLGESNVGIQNLSAAQTQNHLRDSSLFPPSSALRSRARFSECPASENESSRPLPKPAYVPDIHSKQRSSGDISYPRSSREACQQNPSGVPSQVYRPPQSDAEQINKASTPERHQRHSTTKLLTSSISTAYRSRTTAHRITAKSMRTPSQSVAKQQPREDTEENSTPSTSPRSQNSHSQKSSKNSGGQSVPDKFPQKTTSARSRHVHSPSIIPPNRSKESHQKPASKDTAWRKVLEETSQNNDTSLVGRTHPSSNPPVRSTELHNQSESENVQHDVYGKEHEKNVPSLNGHVPSPPESPPRGRRTVVLRRAARILRANHMPTPPEVELKKRQDRWKDQGRPKTVRFVPEDSGRRNYSSGSSGGSPRQAAASRGMEEGVGEVKGNALPSTPQHLQPQVWPRRVDPKNPSHFASSLEMFKRRLKMNQQRVVTETSTEEEDYVIRLENITPLAEPIWQQVSGFKHRPSEPHPSSAQVPQEQQHYHQPDATYHRLPAGTSPAHPQSHAYKSSTLKRMQKTHDFSTEELNNDKEFLRYPHSMSTEDEGDEAILKEEGEGMGRGEIVEEGLKEQTTTTSGKFRESSENWTYVPLGDRGHVPLPQVKTYVLENNLTSLSILQTRVQSHLPLALTQHNVRLHDIFLQRRTEREKMRLKQAGLEGRTGFMAIGERVGEEADNVRSMGRVASADAECRMRRWLVDTEHQRDQQPLVNFKIAIPAA